MEKHRSGLWLVILLGLLVVGLWVFLYKDALFNAPKVIDTALATQVSAVKVQDQNGEEKLLPELLQARFAANPELKYVLVSLWATWCAPCVEELPLLQARAKEFAEGGLDIVLVNFDTALRAEDRSRVHEWLAKYAPTLTNFYDPRDQLLQDLVLTALPFNAIADRNLKWVWGAYGVVDFKKIESDFIVPRPE